MSKVESMLMTVLTRNPHVHLAYLTHEGNNTRLHLHAETAIRATALILPAGLTNCTHVYHTDTPPAILRCPATTAKAANQNQACQNEPIKLGTQIQPGGKDWLGTAGAPVRWDDENNNPRIGILSNWHVMADGSVGVGHNQHQPDISGPRMASLSAWSEVKCCATMYIDAAIADAKIDGLHTISDEIIDIGKLNPAPLSPSVDLDVKKAGRTTGLTHGRITALEAAVKVSYGDFTATFADQIVITGQGGDFSAAGDSGSLIVSEDTNRPVGLLFAGGDGTTIANPIRRIAEFFNLTFDLE